MEKMPTIQRLEALNELLDAKSFFGEIFFRKNLPLKEQPMKTIFLIKSCRFYKDIYSPALKLSVLMTLLLEAGCKLLLDFCLHW